MSALPPDYDDDPERWTSWAPKEDVQESIAHELLGPVLDIACGDGRLARALGDDIEWFGIDSSPTQLAACPRRTVVLADMRALPFRTGVFAEVAQLWCLYHLDDPAPAVAEARRVLREGGRYFTCTNSRTSDPELMWEGYPPTSFDAEEATAIVGTVFDDVEPDPWDGPFYALETREEVRAFCRHNFIPAERAESCDVPIVLTKRGVLIRATK